MGLFEEFEKEAKQKLEERTIAPSDNAWDRLATQLEEKSATKSNAKWYWLAAAAVVGIAVLFSGTFSYNGTNVNQPVVVTKDKNKDTPSVINVPENNKPTTTVAQVEEEVEKPINTIAETNIVDKATLKDNGVAIVAPKVVEVPVATVDAEGEKVIEIVNTLKEMQLDGTEITDADIDSLLLKAQKELQQERVDFMLANGQISKTDALANSLLNEVEQDLDRSFKDRVFNALQEGFIKVKTAVAQRNE